MIKLRFSAGPILACTVVCLATSVTQRLPAETPTLLNQPAVQNTATPDEAAIREAGKMFVKSFNANDAKAVASQWAEDGTFVNEIGERFVGREAIQKQYDSFFTEYPGVQIQLTNSNLRMLSPTSAIVEGVSTLGAPNAPSPVSCQYLAVHVKQNGKWMIASANDLRTNVEEKVGNLSDLEGLIGTWQIKTETAMYETSCRWIADKKFVERTFSSTENGKVTNSGKQIIGLDPLSKQISSWLFDSSGGHSQGMWTRQDENWIVESSGALADGTLTSSVSQFKNVGADEIAWKSINRVAGAQVLPDTEEITLKRVSSTSGGR